jgi:integrase
MSGHCEGVCTSGAMVCPRRGAPERRSRGHGLVKTHCFLCTFMRFFSENSMKSDRNSTTEKSEYLSALAKRELTGIARAQTMSATTGIETPKREKNSRQYLCSNEYTKMLSLAGANPRDYAILQVFLQAGIRVSELANLSYCKISVIISLHTYRYLSEWLLHHKVL